MGIQTGKSVQPKGLPVMEIAILSILTYVAHWSGQILQIGGAQLAPSIPVYTVMALVLAARLSWPVLVLLALLISGLTMVATSSPYPAASFPAHGLSFLLVAFAAKQWAAQERALGVGRIILTVVVATCVSWTLFALSTWIGLSGTPFVAGTWSRFGIDFGGGVGAWWAYGFLGVAVPSAIVGAILAPVLYRVFRRS